MTTTARQLDLRLNLEPAPTMMDRIRKSLGQRSIVRPSDVSAACNVSVSKVYDWIESGEIVGVDVGTEDKRMWQIDGPSVVLFYEKRLGLDPESGAGDE